MVANYFLKKLARYISFSLEMVTMYMPVDKSLTGMSIEILFADIVIDFTITPQVLKINI